MQSPAGGRPGSVGGGGGVRLPALRSVGSRPGAWAATSHSPCRHSASSIAAAALALLPRAHLRTEPLPPVRTAPAIFMSLSRSIFAAVPAAAARRPADHGAAASPPSFRGWALPRELLKRWKARHAGPGRKGMLPVRWERGRRARAARQPCTASPPARAWGRRHSSRRRRLCVRTDVKGLGAAWAQGSVCRCS